MKLACALTALLLTTAANAKKRFTIVNRENKESRLFDQREPLPGQPLKLAELLSDDGTKVEFIEPEEGFVLVLGTEGKTKLGQVEVQDDYDEYADPVTMFEELTGVTAPQVLKDANARRQRKVFGNPREQPPPPLSAEMDMAGLSEDVGGNGDGYDNDRTLYKCQGWWEHDQCNFKTHTFDYCACFSCKTGSHVTYGVSHNIYIKGHAYAGCATQVVEYWWCPDWHPCVYKTLTTQSLLPGEVNWINGFGNGKIMHWAATMYGHDAGWDWFVAGYDSHDLSDNWYACPNNVVCP